MATQAEAGAAGAQNTANAAPAGSSALVARAQAWLRRRWIYAALAAVVFAGVVYALMQATKTSYVPVARDLTPEDQQAAVTALEAQTIPYELSAGGISVPEDMVHKARMELAVNAMPSGRSPGFELFDNNTMGRSTFSQKVNFRRAMEGELARTVKTLAPVERARVHLVMPERRLFQRDNTPASASVIVTLRRGQMLSKRQVTAIRQLVSGAVERLMPNNVAVVDQYGQVLARADGDMGGADDRVIEKTLSFERTLEQRIVELLEPTVGRGRVRAKVSARLDFSRLQEHQERFDPESQTVRSEREKLEKTEGAAKPAGGAPGTGTNLPTRRQQQQPAVFTKPSKADRSDTTKNYVIDRQITKRQTEEPRVQRLSVAVVLDAIRDKEGNVERPHTPQEIEAYRKLLTNAVGLNDERGDTIEVASMTFTDDVGVAAVGDEVDTAPRKLTWVDYLIYGAAGLGLLLMLLILVLVMRARRMVAKAAEEEERERLELIEKAEAAATEETLPAEEALAELGLQQEIAQLRERAIAATQRDVLVTASVLRRWLNDDTPQDN